jgi:tetratricopeptide (TPR) repeat protein
MANVYAKNGEIERAIETFNQVLRLDKDIAEAYFNRGLLYIYTGQKALANACKDRQYGRGMKCSSKNNAQADILHEWKKIYYDNY